MKKTLKVLKTALKAYTAIVLIYDSAAYCGRLTRECNTGKISDWSTSNLIDVIWDDFKYFGTHWINNIKELF